MTLGTHVAFASVLYLGGATLFGYKPDWISWLLAAVASLLPDVDLPPAKIGRLFWFVSVPLERRFGHRTLTHSALMLLAVALLASPLFDIAREQYQRVAGTHWYDLDLTATDNLTLQPVTRKFPVVGVWQNGLIVERNGELRAVGANPTHHNLYPLQARLIQGEPLRVVAERVAMQGHTLRWLLSRIDQSRPYFLLGEVEIADGQGLALTGRLDSVESYNPASYRGGILRLHYARAQELEPWLDLVAGRGEVVVQFWLRPGEAAVTLGKGEEREVERIPKQLRRFL